MLIKINQDTYIESKAIEAIQKDITYIKGYENGKSKRIEGVVIYTRGGNKFYYDKTFEECIRILKEEENDEQGSNQGEQ